MNAGAFGSLDQLGASIDAVASAPPIGPSLDTFAKPLDNIVGKFDALSVKTGNDGGKIMSATTVDARQMTDMMGSFGNQLALNGNTEMFSLANNISGAYFDMQRARTEAGSLGNRTDKASRAEKAKAQQRFFKSFKQLRDGYTAWKQTSYQDWKRKDDAQKKVRKEAADKLNGARKDLRGLLGDHPDDAELTKLVSSLGDVKKALQSGDLSKIELPGGGKFDPKRGSFKDYLQSWKSAVANKKQELEEAEREEKKEETEEKREEAPAGTTVRKLATTTAPITTSKQATSKPAEIEHKKTVRAKALEDIDKEWDKITETHEAEAVDREFERMATEPSAAVLPKTQKDQVASWNDRLERLGNAMRAVVERPTTPETRAAIQGVSAQLREFRTNVETAKDTKDVAAPINEQAARYAKKAQELEEAAEELAGSEEAPSGPATARRERATTRVRAALEETDRTVRSARTGLSAPATPEKTPVSAYQQRLTQLIGKLEEDGKQKLDFKQKYSPQRKEFEQATAARIGQIQTIQTETQDLQQEIQTAYTTGGRVSIPPDISPILDKIKELQRTVATYSDKVSKLTVQLPGADAIKMPELDTKALQAAQTSMLSSTASIRASLPAPSAGMSIGGAVAMGGTAAVGASLAPLAAIADAAVSATVAANAATVAAGQAALQTLGRQTSQVMGQIRSNAIPRPGGGLMIRPEARQAVRKDYGALAKQMQAARVAQPGNAQVQDLSFITGMYAQGILQDNAELPKDAGEQQIFERWKEDAGVQTPPIAPLNPESAAVPVQTAPRPRTETEAAMQLNLDKQKANKIIPLGIPVTRRVATLPSPKRGGGAGPVPIGPSGPLGSAMNLMADKQQARSSGMGGLPEISTLSGDTPLRDDSISSAGGGMSVGVATPFLSSYDAGSSAVTKPFAGEDEGEPLTSSESAERMRASQAQQLATGREFVGEDVTGGGMPEGAPQEVPGEMNVGPQDLPQAISEEEAEEEDLTVMEDRTAMDLATKQSEARYKDRTKQAFEDRMKVLTDRMRKAATKATSTTIRASIEGDQIATSFSGITILTLIAELNLQLAYKYLIKSARSKGVGTQQGTATNKLMEVGEIFEQSFIEDVATVCIDVGICTNIIMMPPCCFCTFPVILVLGVVFALFSMFGLDKAIGIITNIAGYFS